MTANQVIQAELQGILEDASLTPEQKKEMIEEIIGVAQNALYELPL